MADLFQDLLREAYEKGCPFCEAPGSSLYATKEIVGRMDCPVEPDGNLQDTEYDMTNEFIAKVGCWACEIDLYANGDWVTTDDLAL